MEPLHRLSLENIAETARVIDPVFLHSPQFLSESLSTHFGVNLTLKVETINPIGSFKGRGASYFVQKLLATGTHSQALVCASAGNFGQALAYACRTHSLPLTVFASVHANPLKIEKMRSFGATVILGGEDFDAAKYAAIRWAADNNAAMIEDGRQAPISEGAGSIAVELLQSATVFDAILIPLGNGALLTGIARWIKAHSPSTRIIGISSVQASAMHDSWKAGRIVEHATANTIADGIAVRIPIPEAVSDMHGIVDDVLLVEESSIRTAIRLLFQHERLVVEPAGAAGLAALIDHPSLRQHHSIATTLCGSNMTPAQINAFCLG